MTKSALTKVTVIFTLFLAAAPARADDEFDILTRLQTTTTKLSLSQIIFNLHVFRAHNGHFPDALEGLKFLVPDSWGNALKYERKSPSTFTIKSAGPDCAWGTDDDFGQEYKGSGYRTVPLKRSKQK